MGSLGFRGEALPSIAAVAQVEVLTCAVGESSGSTLTLNDGTVVSHAPQGRSQGTTISVRNLFRQVPARLKFLKSAATENSHIASVVSQYALAFPEVKFALFIDGRAALRTPGSGQLIDSINQVYGLEVARNLLAVGEDKATWESGPSQIRVSGMVSSPSLSRSSRIPQFLRQPPLGEQSAAILGGGGGLSRTPDDGEASDSRHQYPDSAAGGGC